MNRSLWRMVISRTAQLGLAAFLLACSAGLGYLAYLTWASRAGTADARPGPAGLPLFALAAGLAVGGALLGKRVIVPGPSDEDWV